MRALQFIAMSDTATVGAVADHLGVQPHTASEALRRLEHRGYVERHRRADDHRVIELALTPSGEHILRQHTGLDADAVAVALESAGLAEAERIEAALSRLLSLVVMHS